MGSFFERLVPFIFLGIFIVLIVVGFVILSYLLIFGALVGLALFTMAWIKNKFFPSKQMTKNRREGIVINQDDEKGRH